MDRTSLFLSLAVLAAAAAPASAATLELEPASDWSVREYDDKCRISRVFGEDEDAVTLWFERASTTHYVNMTVIGRPFRNVFGERLNLSFGSGEPLSRGYITSSTSRGRPVITMFGVSPILLEVEPEDSSIDDENVENVDLSLEAESAIAAPEILDQRYDAVQSIDLSGGLAQDVSLQTGGLAEAMAQLQQCVETRKNGLATLVGDYRDGRGARDRDTRTWAGQIQANYPSYLLREMAQGSVSVRVEINSEGRATFCEVRAFTGPAGFNDAACLGMIRFGRFYPATDVEGDPVWGGYSTRITYRLN